LDRRAGVLASTMILNDSYLDIHYESPKLFTMIFQFVHHGCLHSWNSVVYTVNKAMFGEHCTSFFFFARGGGVGNPQHMVTTCYLVGLT